MPEGIRHGSDPRQLRVFNGQGGCTEEPVAHGGGGSSHWGLIAAGHPEVPLQSPEVEIREALVISHLKDVG